MGEIVVVSSSLVSRAGIAALLLEAGRSDVRQAAGLGGLAGAPASLVVAVPESGEELEALLDEAEDVALLVIGPVPGAGRLREARAGRPWGYLEREITPERLGAALSAIERGLTVIDPVLDLVPIQEAAAVHDLSPREREVLALLGLGLANKAIARRLSISEHTAKFHVASVLSKLGAATRAEAVRIGASRGLVAL